MLGVRSVCARCVEQQQHEMFGDAGFLLLAAVSIVSATLPPRPIGGWRQAEVVPGRPSTANCTWKNFTQKIDHFGVASSGPIGTIGLL